MSITKFLKASFLLVYVFSFTHACQSSKQLGSSFQKDNNGIYLAQKKTIPKDAVRLEVELTGKGQVTGDRLAFSAKVLRYIQSDGSYAGEKPRKGDLIKLMTRENIGLKRGDKIKFDGIVSNDASNNLTVIML